MKRALVIAAHPDDDILGCGGTISKLSDKVNFRVVFIAEGTSCRYETFCKECEEDLMIRKQCALKALSILGVSEVFFNDLPCGKLDQISQLQINKIIEKQISEFKPDTVFTHWNNDSNMDHRKVHQATVIATRPYQSSVKTVLCYEVLSSSEWNFKKSFNPNMFFKISKKDIKNKCLALSQYYTETKPWPHPRSSKGIRTLSRFRGLQAGLKHAEGFSVLRVCK